MGAVGWGGSIGGDRPEEVGKGRGERASTQPSEPQHNHMGHNTTQGRPDPEHKPPQTPLRANKQAKNKQTEN